MIIILNPLLNPLSVKNNYYFKINEAKIKQQQQQKEKAKQSIVLYIFFFFYYNSTFKSNSRK